MLRMITKIFLLTAVLSTISSCSFLSKVEGVKDSDKGLFRAVWIKNLDPEYQTGNLPIGLGNPLIYDGYLFMGTLSGKMNAYDFETGKSIWSQKDEHSLGTKPIIYKKQLIYGSYHGRLFSRNYMTGKLKYAIDLGSPVDSSAIIYRDRIYLHLRNHKLVCLDAEIGKLLWAYKRSIPYTTTLQRTAVPMPHGNKVIVGFADGFLVAFSAEDGMILWERKLSTGTKFVDIDATPLLVRKKIFVGVSAGPLHIIDPKLGTVIRKIPITVPRQPYPYKRGVVVGSSDGAIAIVSANGDIVQSRHVDDGAITSVVEWKKYFAVSTTSGRIHLIDTVTLKVKDTFDLGSYASSIFGKLQVYDGHLVVYSSRNRLYVFR